MFTDGVEMKTCSACNGHGHTKCPTCGQDEGDCSVCSGTGEVSIDYVQPEESYKGIQKIGEMYFPVGKRGL